MNESVIQIILYIVAGILAIVGILSKSKEDNKNNQYDKIYIVGIILTLGCSILLEAIKTSNQATISKKRETEHKQYLDSLSRILKKSDSTLQTQADLQKRTDSLLITSSQISEETQNVLLNTISVLDNQEKTFADEERKRDPLFPMDLEITLKLSFDHEIFKEVLDTFWLYKRVVESNMPYDKQRIEVSWLGNKEKISTITFKNFEKFFKHTIDSYNRIQFILNKNFHIQFVSTPFFRQC